MANTNNTFSAVLLGNLNDFIAPGQACVNPIFVDEPSKSTTTTKKRIELSFETSMDVIPPPPAPKSSSNLIKLDAKSNAAKVSLSDCLACSGCVTTAETVLLKAQSVSEFLHAMEQVRAGTHEKFSLACVTLAPQVVASLAVRFGINTVRMRAHIVHFLKSVCGVRAVVDAAGLPSFLSQVQVAEEFVRRYRQDNSLPLLTSSCPGWVCYAEKTLGREALDHLCEARSPQQVSGVLLKSSDTHYYPGQHIYHVAIMPCPDKKLEASRREFQIAASNDTEVNCVLTATELCDLFIHHYGGGEDELQRVFCEDVASAVPRPEQVEIDFGSNVEERFAGSSGSLCAFVFRYASRELFNVHIPPEARLPFKRARNADSHTLELVVGGKPVLQFATSYGFRNIQEVGRKVKQRQMSAHFVEVMACPSGCVNGGGLMPSTDAQGKRELPVLVARALDEEEPRAPSPVIATKYTALELKTTFNDIKNAAPVNELMQEW